MSIDSPALELDLPSPRLDLPDSLRPLTAMHDATEHGVLGLVKRCTGSWCRIAGPGFDGWVVQEQLWGVYPNEKVE